MPDMTSSPSRPVPGDRWSGIPKARREEIDVYESELQRFLEGKVVDKVFMEFRLRHGVYGQRQAGVQMQRIKIPLGMLTARGLEVLGELAEEYSDGICHITTRQDVQLHFVNILDTPAIFRRLAEAGITTREACGNTVRNVTACPVSGICGDEAFDVTPYARAMAYFLLRHPDAQNFGRKFKVAFSGCAAYFLGLRLTGSFAAGMAAGVFHAFVPFRFTHLPHLQHVFAGWVPLLIVAGIVEGFVSPSPLSWKLKCALGAALFTLLVAYVTLPGPPLQPAPKKGQQQAQLGSSR